MISIIPQPKICDKKEGTLRLMGFGVFGFTPPEIIMEANAFCEKTGLPKSQTVKCVLSSETKGYTLDIDEEIIIVGNNAEEVFHGLQSLKQIILPFLTNEEILLPCLHIKDWADYNYRGYMLDAVRHFFPLNNLYGLIDALALFKINKFHFHLTDDQGWRVEIEKYPLLNEISAFRKQTNYDKTPHGGFYTKQELRDFISYAKNKFIEVIPEFDMPGHFTAILSAYPNLGCGGNKTEVAEKFGIFDTIACGGKAETYTFVKDVLTEMATLFPSPYFHIGGDEAPKARWTQCPDCLAKVKEEGLEDVEELQGFFTNEAIKVLRGLNKTPIVWNESLNSGILDASALVQYWNDGAKATNIKNAAAEGRKFIMSACPPFYLDYPSGINSIKKIYNHYKKGLSDSTSLVGFETPLWTEHVTTWERVQTLSFPRVMACAQLGWGKTEDYKAFKQRVITALPILDFYGISHEKEKDFCPSPLRALKQSLAFLSNFLKGNALESLVRAIKNDRAMKKQRKKKNNRAH